MIGKYSNRLYALVIIVYFLISLLLFLMGGVALRWYWQSLSPVVDWIDPDGPGYRVLAVTPQAVTVQWCQIRLRMDCPGRTEVAVLGEQYASAIEAYPLLIDLTRMTFVRAYPLPDRLAPGAYYLRISDRVQCNPLFENRQILRVPFTVTAP